MYVFVKVFSFWLRTKTLFLYLWFCRRHRPLITRTRRCASPFGHRPRRLAFGRTRCPLPRGVTVGHIKQVLRCPRDTFLLVRVECGRRTTPPTYFPFLDKLDFSFLYRCPYFRYDIHKHMVLEMSYETSVYPNIFIWFRDESTSNVNLFNLSFSTNVSLPSSLRFMFIILTHTIHHPFPPQPFLRQFMPIDTFWKTVRSQPRTYNFEDGDPSTHSFLFFIHISWCSPFKSLQDDFTIVRSKTYLYQGKGLSTFCRPVLLSCSY